MRIVVLAEKRTGWHARDLCRAAAAAGHDAAVVPWTLLRGSVGTDDGGAAVAARDVSLDDADAVLVRTMPAGSLEQVVFRMDLLGQLAARGVRVVNGPRAIEIAVDKYLALSRMAACGLPVPPTIACQKFADALAAFDAFGGDVVIKPLFGSEGFGITRVSDRDLAQRAFAQLERAGSVIYLQRFVEHAGCDHRLFVIGDRVIAAMTRRGDDWRLNVARGARAEVFQPSAQQCDLALRAARACEATVAGVDLVTDRHDSTFVLEVNAVPGWRALASTTGVDIADAIVAALT